MTRSFAQTMGFDWPPDVAMICDGRRVTWAEVHAARRERQERILANKRRSEPPRIQPCYVWTFFIPGWLYHGWHCYLVTRQEQRPVAWALCGRWATPEGPGLAESIMRALPMGLLPSPENFDHWVAELAKRHPRRHPHDPRKAGSVVGWLEGWSRFSLTRPRGGGRGPAAS